MLGYVRRNTIPDKKKGDAERGDVLSGSPREVLATLRKRRAQQ